MLAHLAVLIVGTVFLVTGVIKALNSRDFIRHNYRYGLLPPWIVPRVAVAFIGLECALGLLLLLHVFPEWLLPGSIILLICLSGLTIWATSSGRTEDCGCYGGLLIITPKQSILLNLVYILLLGLAWLYPEVNEGSVTWRWMLALFAIPVASILGWLSRNKPLIDLSRLKVGNRWKANWLQDSFQDLQQGSHFLVFLSKDCGYCKQWIPLMNVINAQEDLPHVMGIMSLAEEEIKAFQVEHLIRFPLVHMDKLLFMYMADAYPTAILIESGVISNKWIGEIPKQFSDRIRQFYESITVEQKTKIRRFSG